MQYSLLTFLVPKPLLGNAPAGEAPASRDGRRTEAGESLVGAKNILPLQAGAWEREKGGTANFSDLPAFELRNPCC